MIMKTMNKYGAMLGAVGILALGGCATTSDPFNTTSNSSTTYPETNNAGNAGNTYTTYGIVQSIDLVQQSSSAGSGIGGSGIGIGTIAGAVIGGVLGNQVGSGRGNTVATVAGVAGGAYVGHEIESRQQQRTADVYRITVRMDDGSYQSMTQNTNGTFRVGDRVRIDNGVMRPY
jgi:outer membrane lipoprotein SlyB